MFVRLLCEVPIHRCICSLSLEAGLQFCEEKTNILMLEKLTGMGRYLVLKGILPRDLPTTAWGQFKLPIEENGPWKPKDYWDIVHKNDEILEIGQRITGLGEMHMHAPGDFHLQHIKAWKDQRGYPEVEDKFFLNLDSWMVAVSYGAGLDQEVLLPPAVIFHQYHPSKEMRHRLKTDHEAHFNFEEFITDIDNMVKNRVPKLVNPAAEWGLGHHSLKEEWVVLPVFGR
jgi:hypothetical protein